MGYDLHITRKTHWSDAAGSIITEAEWRRIIDADPELSLDTETKCSMKDGESVFAAWSGTPTVLGYYAGEITAKDPQKPLIAVMVRIATALDARVQGDDGEIYLEDGTSYEPQPAGSVRPGLLSRIGAWIRHRRVVKELHAASPTFRVGQRVRNPWGVRGTVIFVDRDANGGLGCVRVKLDNGHEDESAYIAAAYKIVEDQASGDVSQ